jgi:hypothetical protein
VQVAATYAHGGGLLYLHGIQAIDLYLQGLVGVRCGPVVSREPETVVREQAALELAYLFSIAGKFSLTCTTARSSTASTDDEGARWAADHVTARESRWWRPTCRR